MVTYPNDWLEVKLNEISDVRDGTHDSPQYISHGYPLVTSKNLKNGKIDWRDIQFISKNDFDSINKRSKVDANDILMGMIGTIGNIARVPETCKFAIKNVALIKNIEKTNMTFLFYYLQSSNIANQLEDQADGGNQKFIALNKIRNFIIFLPSDPEQQAIASVLSDFDEHIENLTELIEKKKAIRDGALEDLLSGRTRLDGFEGEWEEVELGNIISSLKSGLSRELRNYDVGLPVVRANNINDGKLNLNDDVKYWYKDDPKGADTSQYLIKKDDILVNFINSEAKMGTSAIVLRDCSRDTIYTTNILRMRVKDNFCSKFLFYITFTNLYKKYIIDISKIAVNQASFTTVDYKQFKFRAPIDTEEQQAIASVITAMDEEIESLEMEKAKMMGIREGAMDDLLTGRVRLKV